MSMETNLPHRTGHWVLVHKVLKTTDQEDTVISDSPRFLDRRSAGRELAHAARHLAESEPVIVGLTRGGMPVAAEVAGILGAPLDMLIVKKVGAPFQPELGLGALAEGNVQVIDSVLCMQLGIPDDDVRRLVRACASHLDQVTTQWRRLHPRRDLAGRVVIVVDDGLATGSTAHAAIRSVRRAGASHVVLAVPVGSRGAVHRLTSVADEVICLAMPADFLAVGYHYVDFHQVSDDEVLGLLGSAETREVDIPAGDVSLPGILDVPEGARLLVVFAHGSGSSRFSPRNHEVAQVLNNSGIATLLMDLLTDEEARDRAQVFDIERLADRLEGALEWARKHPRTQPLGIALFGASTGAAAALAVAARRPDLVRSVVSRGGRPDLARQWLPMVQAPTLLIVGGDDVDVLRLNREALARLRSASSLEVIPGASHLFEERGTLREAARLARDWFTNTAISRAA